jgi:hypothetical protein
MPTPTLKDIRDWRQLFTVNQSGRIEMKEPPSGTPPLAGWRPGAELRTIDAGGALSVDILGEHYSLPKVVRALTHGHYPEGTIHYFDGDPFNTRPDNLLLDTELETAPDLVRRTVEQNAAERRLAAINEEIAARERAEAIEAQRLKERMAKDATAELDRHYAASELARRAGAPAGRVAVLQALEMDAAEAAEQDAPDALIYASASAGQLPAADPNKPAFKSARKPRERV